MISEKDLMRAGNFTNDLSPGFLAELWIKPYVDVGFAETEPVDL